MRVIEHTRSFPAFGKWGAVADGQEPFSLIELPEDVYAATVDQLESIRRNGKRVLDLSVSVTRGDEGTIQVTARGVTD
jgi:hypothetical protein